MGVSDSTGVSTGIEGRPQLSFSEAEALLLEEYSLVGTASALPSDRDQNFQVRTDNNIRYVLKIFNTSADRDHLILQDRVMSLAAENGMAVQTVIATTAGEHLPTISHKESGDHPFRLVTYLDGFPIAESRPQSNELLFELGDVLGELNGLLANLEVDGLDRPFPWDLKNAGDLMRKHIHHISSEEGAEKVRTILSLYDRDALPKLEGLPHQLLHNDANDYNVVVQLDGGRHRISGLLDFGDLLHSVRIAELAIACAYAMLDKADPIDAACAVTAGYHAKNALTEEELEVLYPLICSRLGVSVCMSSYQKELEPDNTYLTISEKPVWALINQLSGVHPRLAWYRLREACGLSPFPGESTLVDWLRKHNEELSPVMKYETCHVFDFSVGSTEWPVDVLMQPGLGDDKVFRALDLQNVDVGVGRYNEARLVYTTDQFLSGSGIQRTIHIGLDLFQKPGSSVCAPLDSVVYSVQDNHNAGDYGPTVILKHEPTGGPVFYTLYGHLSRESIEALSPGTAVSAGQEFAVLGKKLENGGWAPHLHFQIIGDEFDSDGNYPGVASPAERFVWTSVCPDPNLIFRLPTDTFPDDDLSPVEIVHLRKKHLGPSLSLSYSKPLHIVRGYMQYLYDADGRQYLDCVNNVPHVGHSNPRVVHAATRQQRTLTTNTRYLHQNLSRYAERLTATMPGPLSVVYFVNSGSEANDLALRIARQHTRAEHTVVIDGAYHGNLTSLIALSPYKYDGKGGDGAPPTTHAVAMPDVYRGVYSGERAGQKYAADVQETVDKINTGGATANFIAESALSCGGQIFFPREYLSLVYQTIHAQGGVCIADEVQVGMGRIGSHFWGFQAENVVPDIVTVGKPVGNGHPLGAVITTRELADSFANGMEYFNTFGGNPVSCAIGLAVFDEIEEYDLQQKAKETGGYFVEQLASLAEKHDIIGDVRGRGLFLGFELVRNRETRQPADMEATYVVDRMKEHGILLSTDGPLHNVIKIKPPMVFTTLDVDQVISALDGVLLEDVIRLKTG